MSPTTVPDGMLIVAGTGLPEVIVHLDQPAKKLHPKERKEEDKSVEDPVEAVHYEKRSKKTLYADTKISRPSMIPCWIQTALTT